MKHTGTWRTYYCVLFQCVCFLFKKRKKKGTHRDPRNHISAAIHTCIHVSIPYIHHTQVGLRHAPYDNCVLRQCLFVRRLHSSSCLWLVTSFCMRGLSFIYLGCLFLFGWRGSHNILLLRAEGAKHLCFLELTRVSFQSGPVPVPPPPTSLSFHTVSGCALPVSHRKYDEHRCPCKVSSWTVTRNTTVFLKINGTGYRFILLVLWWR